MDLVIMAAGMGSRFGGLKQIEPIDDDNNFIIDYSIHDAIKAGFDRVIFIIKKENYEVFNSTVGKRVSKIIPVEYVFQDFNCVPYKASIPQNRVKPLGTGHAIYCIKDIVSEKFAVITSDDFYGTKSFEILADFLLNSKNNEFVCIGYPAINTISSNGIVKRGKMYVENDKITNLIESEIKFKNGSLSCTPLNLNKWENIDNNTLVSMSMFGFSKNIFSELTTELNEFLKQPSEKLLTAEFLLPDIVNNMIKQKSTEVFVRKTPEQWHGITYKEDLEKLKKEIKNLKSTNIYPNHLY